MNNKKHDEKSTLNERMQLENSMIKFEPKKLNNMEKDILKKYKAKLKDSFNTKWKLFLFNHVIKKVNKDKLNSNEFIKFEISEEIVTIYSAEYWQMDRHNELKGLKIDKIYEELKALDLDESILKKECLSSYEKYFETQIFPKYEFLNLLEENQCHYCRLTIENVKFLAEKKQLFKKNERGWSLEIDRKNSNFEYKKDNCVMSCYWCNNAKTDEFTYDEFKKIGESFEIIWEARLKK